MNSECRTSSEVNVTFTGRPTGTCSSLISALAVEVLEPPHPPLAGRVDLQRLIGRPDEVEEHLRAQTKITIDIEERDDRPRRARAEWIR